METAKQQYKQLFPDSEQNDQALQNQHYSQFNSYSQNTASESSTSSELQTHALFSKYTIEHEIGHGAQGHIYQARRLSDNLVVAIKQLNISSIKNWKEYELFHREANLLQTINIPGVARFYDAIDCLEDNPPCSYIVQEYINGSSLQQMLKAGHRFKSDEVYDILIQTLRILDRLHHHVPPIIHRDIKPSNLMITPDRNGNYKVTIIDFGAVANPQVQGGGSTVAGTFGYMPPEQLTGKPVPASDIYSVAALAVQLFSGMSPADLPQKDFRLIFEPELQDKPHNLLVLLGQMLDPNVEQRLSDIPEIIERIQNIRSGATLAMETAQTGVKTSYSANYNKKLSLVRDVGQNNNIELWQGFPDDTPRPVPDYYNAFMNKYTGVIRLLINKRIDCDKLGVKIDNMNKRAGKVKKVGRVTFYTFIVTSILEIIFIGIAAAGDVRRIGDTLMILLVNGLVVVSIILFFEICIIVVLAVMKLSVKSMEFPINIKNWMIHPNRFGATAEDLVTQMQTLLQYGRKSFARIDSIEYQPQINPELLCRNNKLFLLCDKPPDDNRAEDIIHSFITQSEPENHYKIGDPLPILYHIENKYFYDEVTSMPFPLSELDVSEPMAGLIVDRSKGYSDVLPIANK